MNTQTTRLGKQHLLEVAEQLFTEHGYQAVSIRDIAQASGVTNAALYYHFPNKEALFDEVIEHHTDKLAQRLQEVGAEADTPREQLVAMLMEYAALVSERRSPLFLLHRKSDDTNREQVKKQHGRLMQRMLSPLEEALQTATTQGELRQLSDDYSPASLLLGLFHGMLQHRKHAANCQITPQDIELVIDIFWSGMKSDGRQGTGDGETN